MFNQPSVTFTFVISPVSTGPKNTDYPMAEIVLHIDSRANT